MKTYLLLTCSILALTAKAQNHAIYYHSENPVAAQAFKINLAATKGAYLYMHAQTRAVADSSRLLNVVLKCDTAGNIIWTAYPYHYALKDSLQFNGVKNSFQLLHGSDSALYMLNNTDSANFNQNIRTYISKIDDRKGDVKWLKKAVDFGLGYGTTHEYLRISDYSPSEILLSGYISDLVYRVAKISKSTGTTIAVKDFPIKKLNFDWSYGPKDSTKQLYVSEAGNLYIFNSDSCYKYSSFENNVLEWKMKMGEVYGNIKRVFEQSNVLFVAGSRVSPANGVITAINMSTGVKKWEHRYFSNVSPTVSDIDFYDGLIQNEFLYTTWHNRFEGSVSEKCFINVTNINTGATVWQKNFDFNAGYSTSSTPQGMVSMDIDASGTLFLTGHASNLTNSSYDWAVMKIAGSNGVLLGQRRVTKAFDDYNSKGVFVKRYGGNLYQLGLEGVGSYYNKVDVNLLRMDTATLTVSSTKKIQSAIQYPSTVHALKDFSAHKKLIVKNIGKRLQLAMTDNEFNELWVKDLGDTLQQYEGSPAIGVSVDKYIYLAAKRYQPITLYGPYRMMNEYHSAENEASLTVKNDSLFIFVLDSTGVIVNTVRMRDNLTITPLRFVNEPTGNRLFFEYMHSGSSSPIVAPTLRHETVLPDQFGKMYYGASYYSPGRVDYLQIRNSYEIPGDSVLFFEIKALEISRVRKLTRDNTGNMVTRILPNVRVVYDVEKTDGNIFYLVGQDSLKNDYLMRFHSNNMTAAWRNTFDTLQNSLAVKEMDGNIYTLVKRGKTYFINKYSAVTGALVWNRAVLLPFNHIFNAKDFVLNKSLKKITVSGSISDTAKNLFPYSTSAYAYTLNENGTELFRFMKAGDLEWSNAGSHLYVDRNSRTLIAGRTHYKPVGYAGFISEADKPALYVTANNGNWHNPATWLGGMVPPADAHVLILHTINSIADIICRNIELQPPGQIDIGPGVNVIITN